MKNEEKHFSKEWEVLTIESGEDTEEEDNVQAEEPPRRTIQGPDQVDVVMTRDQSDRRPTKRRKVVENSGAGRRPESRMVDAQVTHLRMPKRRARPKKKANLWYHTFGIFEEIKTFLENCTAAAV